MKNGFSLGIGFAVLVVIAACGGEGGAAGTSDSGTLDYNLALSRVRDSILAVRAYTEDNDNRLPLANQWMDQVEPYASNSEVFNSPAIPSDRYGFALNDAIAGREASTFNADTALTVFDSRVLGRNATAPTTTLPFPTRYPEGNAEAYYSGRVPGRTGE
jgi:hypothetical protein